MAEVANTQAYYEKETIVAVKQVYSTPPGGAQVYHEHVLLLMGGA
jgi:hypothetical protein